jgi:hypothetical protein
MSTQQTQFQIWFFFLGLGVDNGRCCWGHLARPSPEKSSNCAEEVEAGWRGRKSWEKPFIPSFMGLPLNMGEETALLKLCTVEYRAEEKKVVLPVQWVRQVQSQDGLFTQKTDPGSSK